MKKYLLTFLTLGLLLCEASFSGGGMAFAATRIGTTALSWEISGTTLTIDKSYSSGSTAMPDYSSTTSGNGRAPWYDSRTSITSIVIKNGVTYIGTYAFYSCSNATSVKFGTGTTNSTKSTVSSIADNAFNGVGITSAYYYGGIDGWLEINFLGTKANPLYAKTGVLYIDGIAEGNKLTTLSTSNNVNNYAFAYNTSLANLTLEEGVTSVGQQAFQGCTALTTVNLPSSIETLGSSAFNNASNISTVRYADSIEKWYTNIVFTNGMSNPVYYANSLYIGTNASPVSSLTITEENVSPYAFYKNTSLSSITFAETARTIGAYAFNGCTGLTTITLPSTLTTVGIDAFANCSSLNSATIATSIGNRVFEVCSNLQTVTYVTTNTPISIGEYAFYNCTKLQYLTLSADVTTIASSAFNGDSKLADGYVNYLGTIDDWCSINFGSSQSNPVYYAKALKINGTTVTNATIGVENIAAYAFYQNEALISLTLQSTVKSIGQQAFYKCTGISGSLAIPDGITSIGQQAFNGCTGITGTLTIPSGITALLDNTFKDCSGITSLDISNVTNIQTIGSNTFQNCTGLTGILTIPSTVTSIGSNAFYGCSSLAGLDMSKANSLLTIGSSAFRNCTNISGEIFIPASVTSIGNQAFQSCTSVTKIVSPKNTFPTASSNTFSTMTGLGSSSVHVGSSSYSTATGWSALASKMVTLVSGQCGENVYYTLSNDHHTLYIYGTGDMYNTWGSSSYPWYSYKSDIQHVEISSGVTSIGKYAFYGCSNLVSIIIPISVTTFNTSAFSSCSSLATVNYLGTANQWASCSFTAASGNPIYASKSLQLNGETLTTCTISVPVQSYAFYDDDALQTLVLDDGCTSVGEKAFSNCSALNDITISDDVTTFNDQAFNYCPALNKSSGGSLNYLGTLNQWASISFENYSANPAYNYKGLKIDGSTLTTYNITTNVKQYSFYNNSDVKILSLGTGVTYIGTDGFCNCTSLETISCIASTPLDSIGDEGFCGCSALKDVTLPSSLRVMNYRAFYNNTSLTPANGSVNFLGTADQWASITMNSYLYNPASFVQSLKLNGATLEHCVLSVPVKSYTFHNNHSLQSLTLNEGCTSIGEYAFTGCSNIDGALVIPSALTIIDGYSFQNCTSLDILDMSAANSLQAIGASAFWGCTSLAGELYFPANVENLYRGAFYNVSNISAIYALPTTAPTGATSDPFNAFDKTIPFYVTSATAASNYAAADYWKAFENVFYFGYCGASGHNLMWKYNTSTNTLTISGTGAMQTFASAGAVPWYSFRSDIKSVVLESGVTTIGNYAFYGCNNELFTSISIPQGVTSLGNSAFSGCSHLASVTLPSSLESIGSSAFHSNAFTSISIPSSVSTISSYAFKNCVNLTSIVVPNITTLNEETFYGCSNLASVTLPNSLTSIKKNAFVNCSSLASITIPEYVTEIVCVQGSGSATCPFSGCTSLTSVVWNARACGGFSRVGQYQEYAMPFESIKANINSFTFGENVTSIPTYVCHGMTGLTSITIPSSVTSVGANAFDGCTGIAAVTSNAVDAPSISSNSFPASVKSSAPLTLVSCESKEDYLEDANWNFATIYPNKVDFNLKEHGSAISSQCIEEPETPSVPSPAPSETGYTFGGWYDNEECTGEAFDFSSEITADLTLYAKWTINSYDVTFNMQGHGTQTPAQSINYNGTVSEPSAPSETGYTFGGWFKEAGCINAWDFSEDRVTSATTLYAKWTINSYDVTFDLQGHGSSIAVQSVNYNGTVSQPSDPEAANYTFGGWYKEAGCANAWDFGEDQVTDDLTLYAKWTLNGLALDEGANNAPLLEAYNGQTTNVTMTRSLTNAQYNTFCLPFSLSADQMEDAFGAGYDLEELTDVTYEGETLALEFTQREALVAGKPYLLQPANNAVNPSFENVTISAAAPSDGLNNAYIEYRGVYSPASLEGGNHNLLFLGAGNELFWPESTGNLKGFRAYFIVKSPALGAMRARIVKKEDSATGIDHIQPSAVSSQKYIKDGILYIERDGKTFNAQGQRIK